MTVLDAVALTCIKRDRTLFEGLSFSANAGELVYLRGPNGAGKTSLLRILTGLSAPCGGDVFFNQKNIKTAPSEFNAQLLYLGHKSGINGALSALDNLSFWMAQHGVNQPLETLLSVLATLGLVGLEDVPVRFLSAGQQRRVALSRLWLKKAQVWILDEPFTALDVGGIALLESAFKAHVSHGGIVIATSHQALSSHAGSHRTFDLEYQW